ncbi:MAG: AAA family ATPase [bacterium]
MISKMLNTVHTKSKKIKSDARKNQYITELPDDFDLTAEFKRACELIENSNSNVFITGKAGTGKSTLLQYFRQNTKKKIAVLAPTGIGAINIKGQTIHSFFLFPHTFLLKENIKRHYNTRLFKSLDTIVIDEISMVRADMMDAIDYALRISRDEMSIPFGGVQVIVFGDLFQLPPVVERELGEAFQEIYTSPYFFSSKIFGEAAFKNIELTEIFRQSDERFISFLDKIRSNMVDEDDFEYLNSRVDNALNIESCKNAIILTPTNNVANNINSKRLNKINHKQYIYEALIEGDFDNKTCPVEPVLCLKKTAQVMMMRNDEEKRWVNGTLATVHKLSDDLIEVEIDGVVHEVSKVKWQKVRYKYSEKKGKIEEKVVGTFLQYPIKLAWAITIHKSQGQTFNNVIIDVGRGAFAHGQMYVALSRCKKFDGIKLRRPIIHSDIIFDKRICGLKDSWNTPN